MEFHLFNVKTATCCRNKYSELNNRNEIVREIPINKYPLFYSQINGKGTMLKYPAIKRLVGVE